MDHIGDKHRARVQQISIVREDEGQRIDNFLARHLKGVPKSHIYRILRRGEVRVNSGRIRPHYKLRAGDTVRIPPVRTAAKSENPLPAKGFLAIDALILFEDDRLIVLNKPSGVAVHGGSGISHGVIEALRAERPEAPYLELVHRLDRETSGCLMIAKRRSMLRSLHEQLREGRIVKRYLALVAGRWQGGKRTVSAPLLKNQLKGGERMVSVTGAGKPAETVFNPLEYYDNSTLMEVELKTGRTHQIRVHGAYAGHPLAGDAKYGEREFNRSLRRYGLHRLFLHAHMIGFIHPANDESVTVSAPLDKELRQVLDRLV